MAPYPSRWRLPMLRFYWPIPWRDAPLKLHSRPNASLERDHRRVRKQKLFKCHYDTVSGEAENGKFWRESKHHQVSTRLANTQPWNSRSRLLLNIVRLVVAIRTLARLSILGNSMQTSCMGDRALSRVCDWTQLWSVMGRYGNPRERALQLAPAT